MSYKLLAFGVQRIEDGAGIPADLANLDWQKYQAFLSAGGTPLPADVPNPRIAVQAQINALEVAQIAPRFSREGIIGGIVKDYRRDHPELTNDAAVAILTNPQHPDFNVGFTRLKAFDDAIVALRVKLTALP